MKIQDIITEDQQVLEPNGGNQISVLVLKCGHKHSAPWLPQH
jgi:hypothetical protein